MKYTYAVTGLTCNNCVNTTRQILHGIYPNVVVTLEPPRVHINSETEPSLEIMNESLKETHYRVRKLTALNVAVTNLLLFRPLIIMATLTLIFALVHASIFGFDIFNIAHYFMTGYFLLFGGLKIINWPGFVESYKSYDTLASRFPWYAQMYPGIEFSIGVLMYFWVGFITVNIIVLLLMLQKAHAVFCKLRSGEVVKCACLGGFFTIPVTWVTFFEDITMAAMAVWMIVVFS